MFLASINPSSTELNFPSTPCPIIGISWLNVLACSFGLEKQANGYGGSAYQ